jgi:hypothetical protein
VSEALHVGGPFAGATPVTSGNQPRKFSAITPDDPGAGGARNVRWGGCETPNTLIGPPGSINFIGAIEYEYVISTLRARLELD